jgi:tetratricopeptide (TPR) repeat protein
MEILLALEHHQAGRINEAVQIYQRILEADPDNADALHLMGNAAGQLGNIDVSISLLSRATILFPENTTYLLSLGTAHRIKKQYEAALGCYFKILEIAPNTASAYFGIGNALQSMNRLDDAVASFYNALNIDPGYVEARYTLANLEKSAGKYTEAIAHYRLAVSIKPDFADAHHNLGSALYALGRQDEALASYEQALWCNLPETHNNIGTIYFGKGQFEQALASYRQAIAADPDYAEAYNNIGNTLRKLGQTDDAAAAFCGAIRVKPGYADAYLNLGDLLLESELVEEAAGMYEKAISIAPGMAQAYFNLGVARNRQDKLLTAATCFEQAVTCRPLDHDTLHQDALYNLGLVNARLGRLAEAEHYYRRVLDLNLVYNDAHINLSAILLDDGRTAEARTHLDFAYSQQNLFERHASGADRDSSKTVLILFDAGKGNLNLTHLFDQKHLNIIDWMIEYASDDQIAQLPHYDLVFNAMGDADLTGDTSGPVKRFLQVCAKPLLNHPDKVAQTARHKLPALLEGIDHLFIPVIWRFADNQSWDETVLDKMPLLTRPVHTQGGIGMELWNDTALVQYRATQSGPLYVSCFIDYRSSDSWYRKYRMIFIDRKPYPYHLAISQHWMVHYHTADMESTPWKLAEEQRFMQDPEAVLGATGMRAIEAIGARMDLDYAGIDFSILPDGRILVFEANATMLVHPEAASSVLEHKNIYIRRILDAFAALLKRTANM